MEGFNQQRYPNLSIKRHGQYVLVCEDKKEAPKKRGSCLFRSDVHGTKQGFSTFLHTCCRKARGSGRLSSRRKLSKY